MIAKFDLKKLYQSTYARCKAYLDLLNRLGVTQECADRQTNRQKDRYSDKKTTHLTMLCGRKIYRIQYRLICTILRIN